jgi:predicted house-cleaning noncanonical NTP pyrophosphatase (MazG superfamily)
MLEQGEVPEIRTLSVEEFRRELFRKIGEEALELKSSAENPLSELADLRELIDCVMGLYGGQYQEEDVYIERSNKKSQFGSFAGRQFIGLVSIPEGSKWIEYFEARPDRYPEVIE